MTACDAAPMALLLWYTSIMKCSYGCLVDTSGAADPHTLQLSLSGSAPCKQVLQIGHPVYYYYIS